jgi:GT2 family glycosyltransferase
MKNSVIIPSYNGAKRVIKTLESLEKQVVLPDEVIIVIDGSTDNTEEILRSRDWLLPKIKIEIQKNSGRAKVRNNGAKLAENDLLIFIDDDMILEPHCIKAHVEHHRVKEISILTGTQIQFTDVSSNDFEYYRKKRNLDWLHQLKKYDNKPLPYPFMTAANFSILRSIFFKLEGFDSELTDGEDYDLAVRAFALDIPVFFNSNAYGHHCDRLSCMQLIKRNRQYRESGWFLLNKKPDLYDKYTDLRYRLEYQNNKQSFLYYFFCQKWITSWIDKNRFIYLPEKIRYSLYDVVITANSVYFSHIIKV